MQAFLRWTPPGGTLGTICGEAEARAEALLPRTRELERAASAAVSGPGFEVALRAGAAVALIAEVKRRSPSKGAIAPSLDATAQAAAYQTGGAAAVSILTEPRHFGGSPDDLLAVRAALTVPVLKKDFHLRPVQLLEARALGSSAALVIARALSPTRFREMILAARDLELELLVEIRDEAELELAIAHGATMIGVNNRDLESLVIDAGTAERLIPLIPREIVSIAESGIRTRADVERYAAVGAAAVLVGSSVSAASDPVAATRALSDVPRSRRAD